MENAFSKSPLVEGAIRLEGLPQGEGFAETTPRIIDGFIPIDKPLAIHYHGRSDSSQEGDGHGLQAAV